MAGMFELFNDEESNFRFRITGPDGAVMATSRAFPDKASAVAGIRDMREYAGMGHITDMCLPYVARAVAEPGASVAGEPASGPERTEAGMVRKAGQVREISATGIDHVRAGSRACDPGRNQGRLART